MNLENIRIVLVNTTHPGNIGGVARAMKNMGLSRLYLVAPEKFPDEQAVWRAASAGDLLDSAVVTGSVEEARRLPVRCRHKRPGAANTLAVAGPQAVRSAYRRAFGARAGGYPVRS